MTVGVEKLANLAAGDTVRARYKTLSGVVELSSVVRANEDTQWFEQQHVTGWIGLRQLATSVVHDHLVEVVSVTKPPYAEGATESTPQAGDVVEEAGPYRDPVQVHRWMYCPSAAIPNDRLEKVCEWLLIQGAGSKWFAREDLSPKLRLVQRLQDWPVTDRKWDSDEEFAEQFARAQRMMAKRIRDLPPPEAPTVQWRDRAAYVVEHFDLDDAVDPVGYSDTWQ